MEMPVGTHVSMHDARGHLLKVALKVFAHGLPRAFDIAPWIAFVDDVARALACPPTSLGRGRNPSWE
jgi:hypothetical protein